MRCLTASSSIYSDYLCSEPVRRYTRGFLRQPEEKWCGNGAFLDLERARLLERRLARARVNFFMIVHCPPPSGGETRGRTAPD